MKPPNVFALAIMLVIVVYIIWQLKG